MTTQKNPTLTPDLAAIQARILRYGDGYEICQFAESVRGADIEALQARILTTEDALSAYWFARSIPNADVEDLYILAHRHGFANLSFERRADFYALLVESLDQRQQCITTQPHAQSTNRVPPVAPTQTAPGLTPLQAAIQSRILQECAIVRMIRFIRNVPGADIPAFQARVVEVDDVWGIYKFARDVSGADVEALYARALALGFEGKLSPSSRKRAALEQAFEALLVEFRAQRQQLVAGHQAEVEVAADAGAGPEAPAGC